MIRHISVNIDTVLKFSDRKLGEIFEGNGADIRSELLHRKANGELKIGSDKCEGFDPVTGCPGHEVFEDINPNSIEAQGRGPY